MLRNFPFAPAPIFNPNSSMKPRFSTLKHFACLLASLLLMLHTACAGSWEVKYENSIHFDSKDITLRVGYADSQMHDPHLEYQVRSTKDRVRQSEQGWVRKIFSTVNGIRQPTSSSGGQDTQVSGAEISEAQLSWRADGGASGNYNVSFRRGAPPVAATAKGNIHAVFQWKRNQIPDFTGTYRDDPSDNPPQYLSFFERSTVGTSMGVTNDDAILKGQFLLSSQNPLGNGLIGEGDSIGQKVTTCKVGADGKVVGPDRSFSASLSLSSAYPSIKIIEGKWGTAYAYFRYSVDCIESLIQIKGTSVGIGWRSGEATDDGYGAAQPFWEGIANARASATISDGYGGQKSLFDNPSYKWSSAGAGTNFIPELPINKTESELDLLDIKRSSAEKSLHFDLGTLNVDTIDGLREGPTQRTTLRVEISGKEGSVKAKNQVEWNPPGMKLLKFRALIFTQAGLDPIIDAGTDEGLDRQMRGIGVAKWRVLKVGSQAVGRAPILMMTGLVLAAPSAVAAGGGGEGFILFGRQINAILSTRIGVAAITVTLGAAMLEEFQGARPAPPITISDIPDIDLKLHPNRPLPVPSTNPDGTGGTEPGGTEPGGTGGTEPGGTGGTEPGGTEPGGTGGTNPGGTGGTEPGGTGGTNPGGTGGTNPVPIPNPDPNAEPQRERRPDTLDKDKSLIPLYFYTSNPGEFRRRGVDRWVPNNDSNPAWKTGYYCTLKPAVANPSKTQGEFSFDLFGHPYAFGDSVSPIYQVEMWFEPEIVGWLKTSTPIAGGTTFALYGSSFDLPPSEWPYYVGSSRSYLPLDYTRTPGALDVPASPSRFPIATSPAGTWLMPGTNQEWPASADTSYRANADWLPASGTPLYALTQGNVIPFRRGYPDFSNYSEFTAVVRPMKGNTSTDFSQAAAQFGNSPQFARLRDGGETVGQWIENSTTYTTPRANIVPEAVWRNGDPGPNWVWHHNEDMIHMELVPSVLNTPPFGGVSHRGGADWAKKARW